MFDSRYIDFFLLLNWIKKIFLLKRLLWPSYFYFRENVYELCFPFCKKKKINFLNSFDLKKIHITYFFSVSKVKKTRSFGFVVTFSFLINKNAKIKRRFTNFHKWKTMSKKLITLYKNFFRVTPSITVKNQENHTMT